MKTEEIFQVPESAAAEPENSEERKKTALYTFGIVTVAVLGLGIAYIVSRPVSTVAAAPPVATAVAPRPQQPVAAPVPPPAVKQDPPPPGIPASLGGPAVPTDVLPNRTYLQVGSVDKGIAELLTQGLRLKGIPATLAPGVTPIVRRVIVGPLETKAEMDLVRKQVEEMGFKPFPRRFSPEELRDLDAAKPE